MGGPEHCFLSSRVMPELSSSSTSSGISQNSSILDPLSGTVRQVAQPGPQTAPRPPAPSIQSRRDRSRRAANGWRVISSFLLIIASVRHPISRIAHSPVYLRCLAPETFGICPAAPTCGGAFSPRFADGRLSGVRNCLAHSCRQAAGRFSDQGDVQLPAACHVRCTQWPNTHTRPSTLAFGSANHPFQLVAVRNCSRVLRRADAYCSVLKIVWHSSRRDAPGLVTLKRASDPNRRWSRLRSSYHVKTKAPNRWAAGAQEKNYARPHPAAGGRRRQGATADAEAGRAAERTRGCLCGLPIVPFVSAITADRERVRETGVSC